MFDVIPTNNIVAVAVGFGNNVVAVVIVFVRSLVACIVGAIIVYVYIVHCL